MWEVINNENFNGIKKDSEIEGLKIGDKLPDSTVTRITGNAFVYKKDKDTKATVIYSWNLRKFEETIIE